MSQRAPVVGCPLQAITAAILSAASDLLAQRLQGSRKAGINWRRTLALAVRPRALLLAQQ